jgi:hypothetical protein
MTHLNLSEAYLERIITHHIGNKTLEESVRLSDEESLINQESKTYFLKYFLANFKVEDEIYCFTHTVNLDMNEVYKLVCEIFDNPGNFVTHSKSLAKLLYETSNHPKIKEGQFNIVHFSNIELDEEVTDAIGIFKSETNAPFIKMNRASGRFTLNHEFGFDLKDLDKGCLIVNTEINQGFKVLLIDKLGKTKEAQYWKDAFLQVEPVKNEFHQTNQVLGLTKKYVTEQLDQQFEVTKADKIDLLNRSVNYFKENETFEQESFENEVLQDHSVIESYRSFGKTYIEENDVEIPDNFEISAQAVKKQARVFKSVLKLDKNFHIYIHGDRKLIEQGIDNDGRKFYKIYFQEEN